MSPSSRPANRGLTPKQERYARYLLDATQPGAEPYFRPKSEAANFGLRFQLAFHGYALAMLAERIAGERTAYLDALSRIIDRFVEPATWAYWLQRGADLDPVGPHNIMYSGHLGQLIGHIERLGGNDRYDRPFLLDDGKVSRHEHTHTSVIQMLSDQMDRNRCHGVTCEPGFIYVGCNDHAALSLLLYDQTHGTDHALTIEQWVNWLRSRMVRSRNGVFQVAYLTESNWVIPFNFRVMDGWGMAFLSPFAANLFDELYPRWRATVRTRGDESWVAARWPNERLEISDIALNTAFGYIIAREAGDDQVSTRLERYAERHLGLTDRPEGRACRKTPRQLMVTALFALGESLDRGSMRRLGIGPVQGIASTGETRRPDSAA